MSDNGIEFQHELAEGKYTLVRYADQRHAVLRHGEPWVENLAFVQMGNVLVAAIYELEDLLNK